MTREVKIGSVGIGGENGIAVQSMLKNPLKSYTPDKLKFLYNMGCDLMRFSIIKETEKEIKKFVLQAPFPIIADIQGSIIQAETAIKAGCAAIRINPGNFSKGNLDEIIRMAQDEGTAIRIGINEASLGGGNPVDRMEEFVNDFEKRNFKNLVLSIKSSDFKRTEDFNRQIADRFEYPLHIGLTEAGISSVSAVRSTYVLSKLLEDGIGDTVRYSVAGSEEEEVRAGRELLSVTGKQTGGFRLVACPMCARHGVDTKDLSEKIESYLFGRFNVRKMNFTLAVMGCPVNGRGEAENADIAVCALAKSAEIYRKGVLVAKTSASSLFETLSEIINELS